MDSCIFCKIVKGEIPSYKVYEDENYLAFLDVNPSTEGHTLLIPKEHYRWTYDVPNFGEYWEVARKVGADLMERLDAEWLNFLTHGAVPHAHIHIMPRYEKDVSSAEPAPKQKQVSKAELQALLDKVTT